MSENTPFKLNLGALQNNATTENKSTEIDPTEIKPTEIKPTEIEPIEIKSTEIKPTEIKPIEIEPIEIKSTEIEPIEEKNNSIENFGEKIEKQEEIELPKIIEKSNLLDFSKIQNKVDEVEKNKEELLKEEIKKEEKIEIKEEEKDVFINYESEFNKQKESVLEKIQKFSNYIKPKTRVGFLILISSLSAFGIALLFILLPEKHNLDIYQNNLLIAKGKIECQLDNTKCKKEEVKEIIQEEVKEKETIQEEVKEKETIQEEVKETIQEEKIKKTINKGFFAVEYETKNVDGVDVILYKGETYNDMESFNKIISEEIKQKKLEELRKHILNNKNIQK